MSVTRASFPIVSRVQTGLSSTPTQSMPPSSHPSTGKPKLLDQLREALRSRHYSRRTEQTYCHWVKRFIFFHNGVMRTGNKISVCYTDQSNYCSTWLI